MFSKERFLFRKKRKDKSVHKAKLSDKLKKINRYSTLCIFVMLLALLLNAGKDTIAKYILLNKSHETVMANTFYFSSDYLRETDADMSGTALPQYTVNGWSGVNGVTFGFEIRNYENYLLFNDQYQSIDYDLEFSFVDPQTYKVINDFNQNNQDSSELQYIKGKIKDGTLSASLKKVTDNSSGEQTELTLSNQGLSDNKYIHQILEGDTTFQADKYSLTLNITGQQKITNDIALLITAKSNNISYNKTMKLVVVFKYTRYESYIHTKKFTNDISPTDNNNKSNTQNQSALKYEIATADSSTDDYSNTNITLATKLICVEWNSNLLRMDKFENIIDEKTTKITVTSGKNHNSYKKSQYNDYLVNLITKVKAANSSNNSQYKNMIIADTTNPGKLFLFFDSLPYSRYEITFHKYGNQGYNKFQQDFLDTNGSGTLNKNNESQYYVETVVVDLPADI